MWARSGEPLRLSQRSQNDPPEGLELLALDIRLLGHQLSKGLRRQVDMDARRHLCGERPQGEGAVRLVGLDLEVGVDLVKLNELRPSRHLGCSGLRRIRKVQAVEAAKDSVSRSNQARKQWQEVRLAGGVA